MTGSPPTTGLRWWHVLPAGLACAACCALPAMVTAMVTAGVVGGGTAAALRHWLPAAAIALVAGSLLFFAIPGRLHRRRPARAGGCACGGTGGCASHPSGSTTPVPDRQVSP